MESENSTNSQSNETKTTVEKIPCKACNNQISPEARLCIHCGSPQMRFSRSAYIHRSSWTAIGGLLAFGSLVVLIINLLIASSTLRNQQKFFREEYRPRLILTHDKVESLGNDSLRILFKFENNGRTEAYNLMRKVSLTTLPDSVAIIDTVAGQDLIEPGKDIIEIM